MAVAVAHVSAHRRAALKAVRALLSASGSFPEKKGKDKDKDRDKDRDKGGEKDMEVEMDVEMRDGGEEKKEKEEEKEEDKLEYEMTEHAKHDDSDENISLKNNLQKIGLLCWTKYTLLSVISLLALVEVISVLPEMANLTVLFQEVREVLRTLLTVLPLKCSDVKRRIELYLSRHAEALIANPAVEEDGTFLPTLHSLPFSPPLSTLISTENPPTNATPIFPTLPLSSSSSSSSGECSSSSSMPSKEDLLHVKEGSSVTEEYSTMEGVGTPSSKIVSYQECSLDDV